MTRRLRCTAVAIALLLLPLAAAQQPTLRVELAPDSVTLSPGGNATTLVSVTNNGVAPMVVSLYTYNATGNVTVWFAQNELNVLPGQSQATSAIVTASRLGDWQVRIAARERTSLGVNGSASADALLYVRVSSSSPDRTPNGSTEDSSDVARIQPVPDDNQTSEGNATQEPAPPAMPRAEVAELNFSVRDGDEEAFSVLVENPGATPQAIDITLRLPLGWSGTLRDTRIDLAPNGSARVRGTVFPLKDAADGAGAIDVSGPGGNLRVRLLLQVEAPTGPAPEPVAQPPALAAPAAGTTARAEPAPAPSPQPPTLRLEPAEIGAPPGTNVIVTLVVHNPGAERIAGRARLDAVPLVVEPASADFAAPAGGDAFVTFTVKLGSDLAVGTRYVGVATTTLPAAGEATAVLRVVSAGEPLAATTSNAPAPAAVWAAALVVGVGATALGGAAAWRRWPGLGLFALYARLAPRRALEHPRRAQMLALLRAQPGLTLAEVQRALALSNGVARHHVALLETAGVIRSVQDGPLRRIYPVEGPRVAPTPALRERALDMLRARGRMRASDLAEALGVSRQALHYHLKRLEAEGHIRARRDQAELVIEPAMS